MSVRTKHERQPNSTYFVTFTCYNWLHLIEKTEAYDTFYKWFDYLYSHQIRVLGYVIMPNHIHILLYFPTMSRSLNTIIGNAKRLIAYEIIRRLKVSNEADILNTLSSAVSISEKRKGQLHKVFNESFDAKECYSKDFFLQKLDYIHHNPVSGKWMLASDFIQYPHSSASFYETGLSIYCRLMRLEEVM